MVTPYICLRLYFLLVSFSPVLIIYVLWPYSLIFLLFCLWRNVAKFLRLILYWSAKVKLNNYSEMEETTCRDDDDGTGWNIFKLIFLKYSGVLRPCSIKFLWRSRNKIRHAAFSDNFNRNWVTNYLVVYFKNLSYIFYFGKPSSDTLLS